MTRARHVNRSRLGLPLPLAFSVGLSVGLSIGLALRRSLLLRAIRVVRIIALADPLDIYLSTRIWHRMRARTFRSLALEPAPVVTFAVIVVIIVELRVAALVVASIGAVIERAAGVALRARLAVGFGLELGLRLRISFALSLSSTGLKRVDIKQKRCVPRRRRCLPGMSSHHAERRVIVDGLHDGTPSSG